MTANLQTGMTMKQAAEVMNVSERSVYSARRLLRSGRDDLRAAVERGDMSLNKALSIAYGKRRASRYERLMRAWNACDEAEQQRFLAARAAIDQHKAK